MKLSTKILLTGVLIVALFTTVLLWLYPRIRASAYRAKEEKTQHLVEAAWSVANHFSRLADSHVMTTPQAQRAAMDAVKQMRYDRDGYFWINDQHPRMVMHPTNPALDGADLTNNQDPSGRRLFIEMVNVCRRSGEGAVSYKWPKPGAAEPVAKISYVKMLPSWGWIVGSGVYVDDVEAELRQLSVILFGSTLLVCAMSCAVAWFMARSVSRPVHVLTSELLAAVEHISLAAGQVSQASQSEAQGASEQAAAVEQTSASLEQMTESVRRNSDQAQQISRIAAGMAESVAAAGERMKATRQSIEDIRRAGEEVRKIIKSIDEIAFQTNILALNAAVEAARAGSAGSGFAVVADEVRHLAQRAAQAARETAEKIGDSLDKSDRGVALSTELAQSFHQMVQLIAGVSSGIESVAGTASAQTTNVHQIGDALRQINRVTQLAASSSEETAAAAQELEAQSVLMKDRMKQLRNVVEGSPAAKIA